MNADGSDQAYLYSLPAILNHPQWSSDGRWIILDSGVQGFDILNIDTGQVRAVPDGFSPLCSPNSTYVAYGAAQAGNVDIYTMDMLTGNRYRLTENPGHDSSPRWSPDGLWIAFISYQGGQAQIGIIDARGVEQRFLPLLYFTGIESLDWSPDGTRLAFSARDARTARGYEDNMPFDLYTIHTDGSNLRRILESSADSPETFQSYWPISWRPHN